MADIKLLVLCVVMVVLCLELQQSQAQGDVRFSLRNITYWNNSFVVLEDIGEGDDALLCVTDLHNCCRAPYSNAIGNWFFPNGSRVPSSGNNRDFYRTRGSMVVKLHRRRGGVEGIYRCEIPDTMNVIQTIYIGVYNTIGGAKFVFNGITYQNHSMVSLEDIGEGDQALLCITNFRNCCRHPRAIGNWFFPNGSRVPSSGSQWDFYRTRGRKVVLLHRRRVGVNGIYRCEIPDAMNISQAIYIGVYDTPEGLEVSVQFQLTSEQNATIPTFTLTCISTGSPATTVSWRREDGTVNNRTVTEDENHHITSQILIYPEKATYNHKLAVTGRLLGEYECRVSNKIFSATGKLEVVDASPPTGLSAVPINFEKIKVSWLPPTSRATVTGYQIFYKAMDSNNNYGSVDIAANKKQHTLYNLQGGFVYVITMVTKSQHLPSTVAGPITVTLAMVTNVSVKVANATALLVNWDALKTMYLSNYTIYYSAFCAKLNKVVDNFTKVILPPNTSDIVNIRELRAGVEHEFQVTASLEIEGKVYEGVKSVTAKMVFDEAPFQIHIGPVTFCKTWNTDKAEKMESYIHTGIAKAISCHCNCEFPATFIRSGIFLCWNTQDEVTYRSVIVATEGQSATKLLGFLENWVESEPVLRVEKFGLWVSPEYPVRITSLDLGNPQCTSTTCGESTTETPTTVNPTPDKD